MHFIFILNSGGKLDTTGYVKPGKFIRKPFIKSKPELKASCFGADDHSFKIQI